eukprot:CAMPEP_0115742744 /NCGR_PEP_ID=MMETSP0272-20121206/90698_1 /TAXON_ID=71861 /ORGANISM="Scrippsiella trochoidea, Strain CCMP3099" /LENGTH=40 /DNA_ID= /DNA_START= /DNA_END= /DNA_ORIENTATION=
METEIRYVGCGLQNLLSTGPANMKPTQAPMPEVDCKSPSI